MQVNFPRLSLSDPLSLQSSDCLPGSWHPQSSGPPGRAALHSIEGWDAWVVWPAGCAPSQRVCALRWAQASRSIGCHLEEAKAIYHLHPRTDFTRGNSLPSPSHVWAQYSWIFHHLPTSNTIQLLSRSALCMSAYHNNFFLCEGDCRLEVPIQLDTWTDDEVSLLPRTMDMPWLLIVYFVVLFWGQQWSRAIPSSMLRESLLGMVRDYVVPGIKFRHPASKYVLESDEFSLWSRMCLWHWSFHPSYTKTHEITHGAWHKESHEHCWLTVSWFREKQNMACIGKSATSKSFINTHLAFSPDTDEWV